MFKIKDNVVDLSGVITEINKKNQPFTTFLLSKTVKAQAPVYNWLQDDIADSATTIAEGGDAPKYVEDGRILKQNYLEIFGATATVSNTAQYSSLEGINDLLAAEVEKKTKAIKRRIENKLIHGVGRYDEASGTYFTSGVLEQIHADNRLKGANFADVNFEEAIAKLYDAGVSDNMVAFMPAHMKKNLLDSADVVHMAKDNFMGFDADRYTTVYGEVTFVLTPELQNQMFVLNPDYIELPVLIPMHGQVEPVSGSKQSVYIETQMGIALLNEHAAASFTITGA